MLLFNALNLAPASALVPTPAPAPAPAPGGGAPGEPGGDQCDGQGPRQQVTDLRI